MNVRRRRMCAVGIVLLGIGVSGPGAVQAQQSAGIAEGMAQKIAQDYFALRTAAVVTAPDGADTTAPSLGALPATPAFMERLTDELDVLGGRRATLSAMQEEYTAADTDVVVEDVRATQDGAVVKVIETTTLTYARIIGDEPPNTAYELAHTLEYQRDGNRWVLASDEVDPNGVLPITAMSELPAADSVYQAPDADIALTSAARPAPNGTVSDCGITNGCDATDAASADLSPAPSAAVDVPPVTVPKVNTPSASVAPTEMDSSRGGPPPGMNYSRIVSYAYQYWSSYNGNYRSFGNDCTNFISQSLRAGGWPMDTGWYRSDGNWWYNWANQSYTWAAAENWSRFAPRRTSYLSSTYHLVPSDMMLMDFDRNGNMNHAMVTTYKSSTQPYFTYHTTNTKDRSMRSIYSQYPNSWYYAYRT